jgi:hypothetical protein
VRDDAPEVGRIAFHFNERSTKRRLFFTLGQRLFEQTAETVLLPLDPQKVLNFLARACARNFGVQERAPQELSATEPSGIHECLETHHVFIPDAHTDEMPESLHTKIINIVISLSRKNVATSARISRRR